MTVVSLLIDRCGLSHREAAEFLGVRIDTVKSWSSGRNPTPDGVIDELRGLYAQIERSAEALLAEVRKLSESQGDAAEISLEIAPNDEAARQRGWPCVGAQRAAYGLAIARLDSLSTARRGLTDSRAKKKPRLVTGAGSRRYWGRS